MSFKSNIIHTIYFSQRSLHLHNAAPSFLIGAHRARTIPVRRRYYSIHCASSIELHKN